MKPAQTLHVSLLGTTLEITTDHGPTHGYLEHRLEGMATAGEGQAAVFSHIDVTRGAAASRAARDRAEAEGCSGSRRVLARPGHVFMDRLSALSGVTIDWRRSDDRVEQQTMLADGVVARLAKRMARHLPATFHYEQLALFGGLYPLFYEAERVGWHLLHAGLVDTPAGAIVLVGAAGGGKSTLSMSLSCRPGCRLLSDNLVLYDGRQVCGIPEPVKLDAWSMSAVDCAGALPRTNGADAGWNRREFALPESAPPCRPVAVVLPQFAEESVARRVAAARFTQLADSANHLAFEIDAYYRYASALALGDVDGPAFGREAKLLEMAENTAIIELSVRRGAPLDEAAAALERILPGI